MGLQLGGIAGLDEVPGRQRRHDPSQAQGRLGETVNFTYHPQMALDSALGQFPYPYLQSTSYDAAGRVTQRTLGGTTQRVQTTYEYNSWDVQGGHLLRIKSGTPFTEPPEQPDPTKFQDLYYTYDAVGNVMSIQGVRRLIIGISKSQWGMNVLSG